MIRGKHRKYSHICICPFSVGIAAGIVSGLWMAYYAWVAWFWGYGRALIEEIGGFYYGMAPTPFGMLAGAFWGLVEGFIAGVIFAVIYNFLARRCCKQPGDVCEACEEPIAKPRAKSKKIK